MAAQLDLWRFPTAQGLRIRSETGLSAEVVEQAILFQAVQVAAIALHEVEERAIQDAYLPERKWTSFLLRFVHYRLRFARGFDCTNPAGGCDRCGNKIPSSH